MSKHKPLTPSRPLGMEILIYYGCPYCGHKTPLLAPTKPSMARCDACGGHYPVAPVDEKGIRFIRTLLGNGRAAVDPDYL